MSLDHGILNVPLAKRGNIDAQIDAYKAQQAAARRAEAKAAHAMRQEARAIVLGLSEERLARIVAGTGLTLKQGRAKLLSMARWEPKKVLRLGQAA